MKLIEIANYLVFTAEYIVVLPILVAFYFRAYHKKELKLLMIGLCATLLLDIVGVWFFFSMKNTTLYFFTAIDILTASFVFSTALPKGQVSKIIGYSGFALLPLIAFDAFFWSGTHNNGLSNTIAVVLISVFAIYYLTQLFRDSSVVKLTEEPMFWVSIGVLVNNVIAFFDVFSEPMLAYSQNMYLQFYMVWSVATIFMYCSYAYAFWLGKRLYKG